MPSALGAPPRPGDRGLRLLIVDPDPHVRGALGGILSPLSASVRLAAEAQEALAAMATEDFDAVLASFRLPPGMAGADLLAWVARQRPRCARVLLTGLAESGAGIVALRRGDADAVVGKPWEAGDVRAALLAAVCRTRPLARHVPRIDALAPGGPGPTGQGPQERSILMGTVRAESADAP